MRDTHDCFITRFSSFFLECVIMHECHNNFAFPSHSSVYTAILNIYCFFFPLVYIIDAKKIMQDGLTTWKIATRQGSQHELYNLERGTLVKKKYDDHYLVQPSVYSWNFSVRNSVSIAQDGPKG